MFITEPIPGTKHDRLVFGLEWRAFEAKGAVDARRRYARELLATRYAEYKIGTEIVCGFCTPEGKLGARTRLYSGAARIASVPRVKSGDATLILIEDAGQIFFIFVVRGAIRIDEVTSPEAAATRRLEVESLCDRNGWQLVVLTRGNVLGEHDGEFNLSEIIADRKTGRISALPMQVPSIVYVLVGCAVVVYGGTALVHFLAPPPPPPPKPPTYQQRYAIALAKEFSASRFVASALAPDLLSQIGASEPIRRGWEFAQADCTDAGMCHVEWKRHGGTYQDFDAHALSAWRPISFSVTGNALGTTGPNARPSALVPINQHQKWMTWEQLKETLQQPAQLLSKKPDTIDSFGYKVTLAEPRNLLLPVPLALKTPLVRVGTWQIDGFKWQMRLLQNLPPNMVLTKLTVQLRIPASQTGGVVSNGEPQAGLHFHAEGKFYVF